MLKLPTLVALFICFVYSNNEHNIDSQLSNEHQILTKHNEDNKNSFQTLNAHYIEEKKTTKPCKQNQNRLHSDDNPDVFETLPITATTEQSNSASFGNQFLTATIHGANYNYKTENIDSEIDDSGLNSKNCECGDCVLEANKKTLQIESLALGSNINPLNNAALDIKTGQSESVDSKNDPINNDALYINTEKYMSVDKNNNLDDIALNIESSETGPINKGTNINTRRRKCGRVDKSENSSTTHTTRRILPGIIDNPTKQELEDNKLYQDNPQRMGDDDIENRQNFFPNVNKISNNYDIDIVHSMNINDAPVQNVPGEDTIESQLIEPTRGKDIYDMKDTGVMLLENSRVCYACSTISDPTCWTPDRRTTVKYCQKGHRSCLTKSFKHKGKSVIIRDCGSQCVSYKGEEKYSSCSICHSDVCNGASSMRIFKIGFTIIVLCGILFRKH